MKNIENLMQEYKDAWLFIETHKKGENKNDSYDYKKTKDKVISTIFDIYLYVQMHPGNTSDDIEEALVNDTWRIVLNNFLAVDIYIGFSYDKHSVTWIHDEWESRIDVAKTRSAIEILLDLYDFCIFEADLLHINLSEYDKYIRENVVSGLPIELVPDGIPSGHWWWFHPEKPPNNWGDRIDYIEVE